MAMRRRTVQRLTTIAALVITYTLIGTIWESVELSKVTLYGPTIGGSVGLFLALLELSKLMNFTNRLSFLAAIVVKSVIYMVAIAIPLLVVGFIGGYAQGLEIADFNNWITTEFGGDLLIIYLIHVSVIATRHINRMLGPRTLWRYITGKYHHPTVEDRVFMFLDMKSSTTLAEELGPEKFFKLLNAFFRDISEPILEREAEIYQYVGDEIVLTWETKDGIRDNNCIFVFIEILAQIHSRRKNYEKEFGLVPEFKAGVHFGEVVTAEIGDIKKEIVYNGDVLNTTARIQSICNEHNSKLIASESLVNQLSLPEFVDRRELGPVQLRGKHEAVPLVALM